MKRFSKKDGTQLAAACFVHTGFGCGIMTFSAIPSVSRFLLCFLRLLRVFAANNSQSIEKGPNLNIKSSPSRSSRSSCPKSFQH